MPNAGPEGRQARDTIAQRYLRPEEARLVLVLHAVWVPGSSGASVWAEDSERAVTSRSEALRTARPHPFAVPADRLGALVPGDPAAVTVLLPSLRRAPLDSPEIARTTPRPSGGSPPSLLAWTVPAVVVALEALTDVLGRFVGSGGLDATRLGDDPGQWREVDVRPAASLRYLLDLARFADELVTRGRVLPAVELGDDGDRARWRAVLTGPDAIAAHALIGDMPPAFRSAQRPDQDVQQVIEQSPAALFTHALDTVTDALVRKRLTTSFLPPRRGRRPAHLPAAEAWLDALTGSDPLIAADADDVELLDEQLLPWRNFGREDPGPAHLVLRLCDPERTGSAAGDRGTDGWRIEFLLRSRADPSLLVDAAQVWSDDGTLGRWLQRPREVLLTELARAQRVYPELERGLRRAQPSELSVHLEDAYRFLADIAAVLVEAGFEVLLPAWCSKRRRLGLRLSATPSDQGDIESVFGREQLCDFRWDLAVGDHGLTEDEIAALAEAKAPLVLLRGEWVTVDQEQLGRGLDFLKRSGSGQQTVGEVLTLALGHPDDLDLPLELTDITVGGWLGTLLNGTAADSITGIEPPESFTATLRPYQTRGLGWLDFLGRLGLGACLADDMGLGKTVQLLALETTWRSSRDEGETPRPTLLICPVSLIGNWEAEAARFAPELGVIAHHGSDRPHGAELGEAISGADMVITSYTTALNDIDELVDIDWERIVLDEAQAIKNRLARTSKAVRRLRAGQRIALTGTPVENRLAELWSIMDFLNPGTLGTPELFRARFATPIERYRDDGAAALLRRITRPYILRRLKTDPTIIDDLPEKIEIKQYYRLTVEQASLYQSVVDEMMQEIENSSGIERRGNILAAMTKLKQICNHPAQLLHDGSPVGRRSGKIIRLEEILDEILAEGDRVLCFTQFTEFAELLLPYLASRFDTDIAYLSGSTSRDRRQQLVERFQSGEGPPVFLLSLKAGGTGLNLTAANHVIHLDRWWNPAVENQATDRAFRIGQKRRVQVRKFIGTGTLEERIDQMIENKKALADLVVGQGESWLTELSTKQLRELFTLSKEAVGE